MRPVARKGYTILELVIVLAVLIILGSVLVPTLSGLYGNTRQKAAADLIRSRIVEARAKAMERGAWFRVAISQDKTRIRLAPDAGVNGTAFASLPPSASSDPQSLVVEDTFEKVTAELVDVDPTDTRQPDGEWLTVFTVGPEGICQETTNTTISIKESNYDPVFVQVRYIAASSAIVGLPKNGGKK
jgi:type II secretory pathway pseudopilin PulG